MAYRIRPVRSGDVEILRTLIAALGYEVSIQELHMRLQTLPEEHAVYIAESKSSGIGWIHVLISQT